MKEQFISYELAVKLKELGFDEDCLAIIPNNFKDSVKLAVPANGKIVKKDLDYFGGVKVPLWQQAFDWFREKYAYFTSFDYQHGENNGFFYCIINIEDEEFYFPEDFEPNIYKTYEEASIACLEKLIELCK